MRSLPPLAAVRAFEAAARLGNFTRAGAELGMTQAAVSYQIRLLEERLGVRLFVRSGRGVELTEAARRVAPMVSAAFDGLSDAFAGLRAEDDSVLAVTTSDTFAANWLALRLGQFQLERPHLAVRLHTTNQIVDIEGGEIDAAIRNSACPPPGVAAHFLMRVPIAPLASPELLARYPAVTSAEAVFDLPRLSPDDSWWKAWLEQVGGNLAEPPAPSRGIRLDSQLFDGNAALAGQGVAMLNPWLWRRQIDAGQLVQIGGGIAWDGRSYWFVHSQHRRHSAKLRAFREWLVAGLSADIGDDPWGMLVPGGDEIPPAVPGALLP